MGKWSNRDLITEIGGLNLYLFVENDFLDRIDRYGLMCSPKGPPIPIPNATWELDHVELQKDNTNAPFLLSTSYTSIYTGFTVRWRLEAEVECECTCSLLGFEITRTKKRTVFKIKTKKERFVPFRIYQTPTANLPLPVDLPTTLSGLLGDVISTAIGEIIPTIPIMDSKELNRFANEILNTRPSDENSGSYQDSLCS